MANEHFGACLKHARTHKMISQNRLAAEAGTTQGTISNYEAGRAIPSEESARKLAAAMGLVLKETDGDYYFAFPDSERLTETQLRIIDTESDADGAEKAEEANNADDAEDTMTEEIQWAGTAWPMEDPEENAVIAEENIEETASVSDTAVRPGGVTEDMIIRATLEQIKKEIEIYEQQAAERGLSFGIASETLRGVSCAMEMLERLVGE